MDCKDIFWKLFEANGEEELKLIIEGDEFLSNDKNWYPYGGKDKNDKGNFGTFENQQPHPVPSLVEKITNSIDSILLKECKLREILPNSLEAPRSVEEALEKFFEIPKGDLAEKTDNEIRELAKNIQLVSAGKKNAPDILIFDNGEGQYPDDFHSTFLSIGTANKNDIHFVQGKYNMGSTGAVTFCGQNRYQLIVSRKNEELHKIEKKNTSNNLGFTIVRRHVLSEEEKEYRKNSWYEYFCIGGQKEKIPEFEIENNGIPLGLSNDIKFKSGAVIKLFSYKFLRGAKGTIRGGLYQQLNQYLYSPALPFTIEEKREHLTKLHPLIISGNKVRLSDTKSDVVEKNVFIKDGNSEMGTIEINAIVLRHSSDKQQLTDRRSNFIGKNSIIFTINGQVHGNKEKKVIAKCNLNYLKDDMLIHINCDHIDKNFRQDLFMGNRTNVRESVNLEKLMDVVISAIKNNKQLKELNKIRRDNFMSFKSGENEREIIEKVMSNNPKSKELMRLLKDRGINFARPNKENKKHKVTKENKKHKKSPALERYPSIFKINLKEKEGKLVKGIPLGGKGTIEFETNVNDDYFYRSRDKGELTLEILRYNSSGKKSNTKTKPNTVEDYFNISQTGPDEGSIRVTFAPKEVLDIGDEVKVNAKLSSPSGNLEVIFYIRIDNKNNASKKRKEDSRSGLSWPKMIKISKSNEKWITDEGKEFDDQDWDEDRIVKIFSNGDVIDVVAINVSSNALNRYISSQKANNYKKIQFVKDEYTVLIYLNSMFLYFYTLEREEIKDTDIEISKFISDIFKKYGEAILYINPTKSLLDQFE